MDECLDLLGDATENSTLEAGSGYWQTEITEENRDKLVLHLITFSSVSIAFF